MPFEPLKAAGGRINYVTGERMTYSKTNHISDMANQALFNGFLARAMRDPHDRLPKQGSFGQNDFYTYVTGTGSGAGTVYYANVVGGWGLFRKESGDLSASGQEFDLQYFPVSFEGIKTQALSSVGVGNQRYDVISLQVDYVSDLTQTVAVKAGSGAPSLPVSVDEREMWVASLVVTEGTQAATGTAVVPAYPSDQLILATMLVSAPGVANPVVESQLDTLQFCVPSATHMGHSTPSVSSGMAVSSDVASFDITVARGKFVYEGIERLFLGGTTTLTLPPTFGTIYSVDLHIDGTLSSSAVYTSPTVSVDWAIAESQITSVGTNKTRLCLVEVEPSDVGVPVGRLRSWADSSTVAPSQTFIKRGRASLISEAYSSPTTTLSFQVVDEAGSPLLGFMDYQITLTDTNLDAHAAVEIGNVTVGGSFAKNTAKDLANVGTSVLGVITVEINRVSASGTSDFLLKLEPVIATPGTLPQMQTSDVFVALGGGAKISPGATYFHELSLP